MDLNYVLLWMVGFSCGALLFRGLSNRLTRYSGWTVVSGLLIALLAAGLWMFPDVAGYCVGAAWFILVMLPALLSRKVHSFISQQRYGAAARLASVIGTLHPADGWRQQPHVLSALHLITLGRDEEAARRLEALGDRESVLGRYAKIQLLKVRHQWPEIVAWVETHPQKNTLKSHIATWVLYIRALGETGQVDAMLDAYRRAFPRMSRQPTGPFRVLGVMFSALSGRADSVERDFAGPLSEHPEPQKQFWIASAYQAAGRHDEARPILEALQGTDNHLQKTSATRRLEHPLDAVDFCALSPENQALLEDLARDQEASSDRASLSIPGAFKAYATYAMIAIQSCVFLFEIPGGSTRIKNLIQMGALLSPPEHLRGEYWRMITAGFLHFGVLHLVLNLAGILYFGRIIERAVGAARFLVIFLASSIGAMGLILLWSSLTSPPPQVMVGASASLMGLVGASAAFLLRAWLRTRASVLARQLRSLLLLLLFQTVFDLVTPVVSFAAHSGGALIGFGLGWVLWPHIKTRAAALTR